MKNKYGQRIRRQLRYTCLDTFDIPKRKSCGIELERGCVKWLGFIIFFSMNFRIAKVAAFIRAGSSFVDEASSITHYYKAGTLD